MNPTLLLAILLPMHGASRPVGFAQAPGLEEVPLEKVMGATWAIPLTSGTITLTVGGLVRRPVVQDGRPGNREHLGPTISLDHDLVDGAPAARFMTRLDELLARGQVVGEATTRGATRRDRESAEDGRDAIPAPSHTLVAGGADRPTRSYPPSRCVPTG
jgi:hypothetical protein